MGGGLAAQCEGRALFLEPEVCSPDSEEHLVWEETERSLGLSLSFLVCKRWCTGKHLYIQGDVQDFYELWRG